MCVFDVYLSFVKCEIFVTWKFWLEFSCFHYCLISAVILCSYIKLRSFILLQDLIQKYEEDLSQLSKRCEEMKKLYSNVLVCVVLKCNENRPTLLKEKKERDARSSHASTCFIVILSTGTGKKKCISAGIFWMKIWLLLFFRTYSPHLRGFMAQIWERKVDVQQFCMSSQFNGWMFSKYYRKQHVFQCLAQVVSSACRASVTRAEGFFLVTSL